MNTQRATDTRFFLSNSQYNRRGENSGGKEKYGVALPADSWRMRGPLPLRTGLLEREETSTLHLSCLDSGEQRLDSPGFRVYSEVYISLLFTFSPEIQVSSAPREVPSCLFV